MTRATPDAYGMSQGEFDRTMGAPAPCAPKRVVIYGNGFCYCSACAPGEMTGEEVAAAVNAQNPTGLDHPWAISTDPTFKGGEPNPCVCNDNPTRVHWLLAC